MQADELPYDAYLDGHFSHLLTVRTFGPWQILSASRGDAFLLFIVNHDLRSATLCRYESCDEQHRDVEWLKSLPPDGMGGAAMGAFLKPLPPSLSAGNAKPLAETDNLVE